MGTAASGWLTARPSFGLPSLSHSSQLVRFGPTDLYVSRLCQGTAFRQLQRSPDDPRGERILRHCIDIGINFFDSSNTYGAGGSEKILGKAIAGQRHKVVICTKVAIKVPPENSLAYTRDYVLREAEGSLRRLGTDTIDLYLYHFPDNVTPLEDLAETMNALVQSGKFATGAPLTSFQRTLRALSRSASRKDCLPLRHLKTATVSRSATARR